LKDIILSIQNTEIETLGNFKELFESDGYKIETINVKKDKIPQEPDKYAGIVILGGYMSVYETLPYLNEEQDLIRNANRLQVPLLGICLGSQLVAQALGGKVYKGKQKEIGWFDVVINNEGKNDIFKGIANKSSNGMEIPLNFQIQRYFWPPPICIHKHLDLVTPLEFCFILK